MDFSLRFINDLSLAAEKFSSVAMVEIYNQFYVIIKMVMMLYVVWTLAKALLGKLDYNKFWVDEFINVLIIGFTIAFTSDLSNGQTSLAWTYLYLPLKAAAIGLSVQMMAICGVDVGTDPTFQGLANSIVSSVSTVITISFTIMTNPDTFYTVPGVGISLPGPTAIANAIIAFILAIPYIAALVTWCYILVECMFTYLAVTTCIGPLILMAAYAQTRQHFMTGMRLMLHASLALVFTSVAWGFALNTEKSYGDQLQCIATRNADSAECKGLDANGFASVQQTFRNWGSTNTNSPVRANGTAIIWTSQYWGTLLVGWIAILLMLRGNWLASVFTNIHSPQTAGAMTGAMGMVAGRVAGFFRGGGGRASPGGPPGGGGGGGGGGNPPPPPPSDGATPTPPTPPGLNKGETYADGFKNREPRN